MTFEWLLIVARTPHAEQIRAEYYRWWTLSVSRHHLKLGPVTVGWCVLDGAWRVDVIALFWYRLFRISIPCRP